MKRALNVVLLVCVSVVFWACEKSPFSAGAITDRYDTIRTPFHTVEFRDNVNVNMKLKDADHPRGLIHIKTGENLIDDIFAEIDTTNGVRLVIGNNNTNNFLRPYDTPLEVDVYYDSIYKIIFNSNGIVDTDTIKGIVHWVQDTVSNDSIKKYQIQIEVDGGSGELHMQLDGGNESVLKTNYLIGTADLYAKGSIGYAETRTNYSCHGLVDYRYLEIHSHRIDHFGTNRVFTKVFSTINAHNYNNGEIYYLKYKKQVHEYIPPGEDEQWGHYGDVWHYCPEALYYNDQTLNSWKYNNNIPGLVKDTIN